MKKNYLILVALIFLSFLVSGIVYENDYVYEALIEEDGSLILTSNTVNGANVFGIVCADSACASYSSTLWSGQILNTGVDNFIILEYPTTLQSLEGYGIYFFKENYIPFEVRVDLSGSGTVGPFSNYLTKKELCSSEINSFEIEKNYYTNGSLEKVKITTKVLSPINSSGPIDAVPSEVAEFYEVGVNVKLKIKNSSDEIISFEETKKIEFSGEEEFVFEWKPENSGEYIFEIVSNSDDSICINSQEKNESKNVEINLSEIENDAPLIQFIFPQNNAKYDFEITEINFSIYNDNLASCWYSLDAGLTNISISCSENITGISSLEGENSWCLWANNSLGNENKSCVNFEVNTSLIDITAPLIFVTSPTEGKYSGPLFINFSAEDSSGIKTLWYFNGIENKSYNLPTYENLNEGNYTLIFYAEDNNGNLNFTSVNIQIDFSNLSLPLVYFISPVQNFEYSKKVLVEIYTENASSIWWSDGKNNFSYNSQINVNLFPGNYTFIAYAENENGLNFQSVNFEIKENSLDKKTSKKGSSSAKVDDALLILSNPIYYEEDNSSAYLEIREKKDNVKILMDWSLILLVLLTIILTLFIGFLIVKKNKTISKKL